MKSFTFRSFLFLYVCSLVGGGSFAVQTLSRCQSCIYLIFSQQLKNGLGVSIFLISIVKLDANFE